MTTSSDLLVLVAAALALAIALQSFLAPQPVVTDDGRAVVL